MIQWNVAGWGRNKDLKAKIIKNMQPDIAIICETWLLNQEIISIEGYTWIGKNRVKTSNRAKRNSGGVGILVSKNLLTKFKTNILDVKHEDAIMIFLKDRQSKSNSFSNLIISGCYVSPERSSHSVNIDDIMDKIGSILGKVGSEVPIILAGDFNARTENLEDGLTKYSSRRNIDTQKNMWGTSLIEFLRSNNLGIVNGRLMNNRNNYNTCISNKGYSVVDYFIGNESSFPRITNFEVITMVELIQQYNYISHPSDHSILKLEVNIPIDDHNEYTTQECDHESSKNLQMVKNLRYDFEKIPVDFMKISFATF